MANLIAQLLQRLRLNRPSDEGFVSLDDEPQTDTHRDSPERVYMPVRIAPLAAAVVCIGVLGGSGYYLWRNPPLKLVQQGEIGLRHNQLTAAQKQLNEGPVLVLPGIHRLRTYPLREQTFRPKDSQTEGFITLQSVEGLTLGVELSVRYALDPSLAAQLASNKPADWDRDLIAPAVKDVVFKLFPRYTVREVFSSKRAEILAAIESQLKPLLAGQGMLLKAVSVGAIALPQEYKQGMEKLLAEELASEKMRFTLELKEKNVKAAAFEAEAEKVRQELAAQSQAKSQIIEAESRASAQIIEARAQEQAMAHILPFKQRQIEQRKLEAEAEKAARVKAAEGTAAARIIEAEGEANSRLKLADAEVYRQERLGKLSSEQMQRDGALVTQYPLLIQKLMAEKLSDKINVIVASPPADGGFIGNTLLGAGHNVQAVTQVAPANYGADASEADHSVEE